jgi:hypothetical protein
MPLHPSPPPSDDRLEGHAGDPDADPDAVDPEHTPDEDYREPGQT